MDYRLYHAVNQFVLQHSWLGRLMHGVETYGVVVFALATAALWLLARPGASSKWKLASGTALAAAGLALLVNQLIGHLWERARPFAAHPDAHLWVARTQDPSFPSDHASAAFAIAFTLLAFDALAGRLFLAGAVVIAVGRVVVGAHYPGDVAAGLVVGALSAYVLTRLARVPLRWLLLRLGRLTDAVLAPVWAAVFAQLQKAPETPRRERR